MSYKVKCPVCGRIFSNLDSPRVPAHDMKGSAGLKCQWEDTTGEVVSVKP